MQGRISGKERRVKIMYKFNQRTRKEEPYEPPVEDGYYPIYCDDMDKKINCAQCGKEITFGEGYTSREIYSGPWGHTVCIDCMEKERERENDATNN